MRPSYKRAADSKHQYLIELSVVESDLINLRKKKKTEQPSGREVQTKICIEVSHVQFVSDTCQEAPDAASLDD